MPCFYDPHQHGPNNVTCLCALFPFEGSNLTFGLPPPAIGDFRCSDYDQDAGKCAINADSLDYDVLIGQEKTAWANAVVNDLATANKTTAEAHCRAELSLISNDDEGRVAILGRSSLPESR